MDRDDELARLRRELQSRDDELVQLRALVMSIYGSGSWRMTRPLRLLRRIAQALKRQSARLVGGGGIRLLFGRPAVRNSAAAPTASTQTEL